MGNIKKRTSKKQKEFQEYCRKIASILIGKMSLGEYRISLEFVSKIPGKKSDYPDGYSADIAVDSRYLEANIRISDKVYKRWLDCEYLIVTEVLAHELSHILTDPYCNFLKNIIPKTSRKYVVELINGVNETQTERISKAIMNCMHWEDYDIGIVDK